MKSKNVTFYVVLISMLFLTIKIFSQSEYIYYGPFHKSVDQPHPYFNLVFRSATDTSSLRQVLTDAVNNNYKLVINLAGQRNNFQDSEGHFSLELFKERLDQFRDFDLSSYQDIIICRLLFDEPQDPRNWGGAPVDYSEIDLAAKYGKELFPSILTGVGAPATWLSYYGTYNFTRYFQSAILS